MTYAKELLKLFPTTRIKPVDGMAVTADVWEEAHDYHRNLLRYHSLFNHGSGIVTGLEVIARDPADSMVYILPGIAVDSVGRTIILPEPFGYDFDQGEETLYLLLTHQEGRPQNRNGREDAPLYVMAGYGLEAVSVRPSTPFVELARITRTSASAPIHNAQFVQHPIANQIDLRYREEIGAPSAVPLTIGLLDARNPVAEPESETIYQEGISRLATSLRNTQKRQVWADLSVSAKDTLDRYSLLYLVVSEAQRFDEEAIGQYETKVLYDYLQNGGTIIIELTDASNALTAERFNDLSQRFSALFNHSLSEVEAGHPLLESHHFFAQLPAAEREPDGSFLSVDRGLILTANRESQRWGGQEANRLLSREEIRTALEWGENLLVYAIERRQQQ